MKGKDFENADVRSYVRERYGRIAQNVQEEPVNISGCCSPEGRVTHERTVATIKLYDDPNVGDLPLEVTGLGLGCGDPVTLASLQSGQTVLDLGAGGGIDCFLASRQVGPTGRVIGVDMTPAMLDTARANRSRLGLENVEFRLGEIEHLPVADQTVDVIISNCVINLSPDKPQVLREAYRVLRPGGRLAISDVVTRQPLSQAARENLEAWAGCVSGALGIDEYEELLAAAGFTDIQVQAASYAQDGQDCCSNQPGDCALVGEEMVFSARITAKRPI